jgi:LytS/YehU family sensor histidine kinase
VAWSGERVRSQRHEALSRQAQLAQLTQQLQPHFLFNALNTVSALIHTDPQLADTLLTRLATLLRAATDAARQPEQPLADELTLLRAYAEIMVERFSDRVSIDWQIDAAALACVVPTLSLQPLLENCFRHAVEPRRAMTHIVVRARRDGATLKIAIDDDGGVLKESPRSGVGLSNLRLRLDALHGAAAHLRLQPRDPPPGVSVSLELPCGC